MIGDDKDARIKAQQAVANEELRIAQSKYDAISQMDEEQWSAQYGSIQAYEMARLDAENNVQDAIKKTTDLSIASQNQAIKVQLDELAAASSLVGSLRGLFGALGDDLEAFAIAEQALAVAQIIIDAQKATMEAMVASFQLGPIAGPIWFATQKGIITAQAAIASATTLAQAIPSFFSEGGLVTGPGTGTSDSIPAMLSNGEAVMTAQAVNDWGAMLSAMNVASGGNAIQVSNLPQRNDGMKGMERMMERALMNMPAPIVSVVDINKGQKRVKVQNSLGKLGRKNTNNNMNTPNKKVGRPRAYTPEAKFEEYVEWVKANPRYSNKASAGEIIPVPTQRPLTLVGFCQFAKISRQNFYEYESREEFSDILTCVREAIEADQLEGALCGQYDSGIVARVLHLADRQDVTTNGKEITTATQPISVVLDPEAAKIIQSIGRRTVKE